MTARRSYEALQLDDEVHGVPCPLDTCPAHDDPTGRCAGPDAAHPLPAAHWQRIRAAQDPQSPVRPPSSHREPRTP
jgi:hypothetical protein